MRMVLSCEIEKKADLVKMLEADPYAHESFARAGYKVKDGASVGLDPKKLYVHVQASDELCAKLVEKAKPLAVNATDAEKAKVLQAIDDEENSAETGFGAIFG